jgi:predicted lipid-binding transport protein (Tim44 family)
MKTTILLMTLLLVSFGPIMLAQEPGQPAKPAPDAQQPAVIPQQGQSPAQKQQDLAECYDIAKAKTGIDPRALSGAVPGIPGMPSTAQPEAAAGAAAPEKDASDATQKMSLDKFQLANQACLQARGYVVKAPKPKAEPPK